VPENPVLENVVLLHGFAGTRRTWDGVVERLVPERYTPLAFDLPGHGDAVGAVGDAVSAVDDAIGAAGDAVGAVGDAVGAVGDVGDVVSAVGDPRSNAGVGVTFADCVEHVLAHSPARFALCGYSLGGRVGLNVALAAPERVQRLVLVSSTAGIADEDARAARRAADEALARNLEERSFEEFMDRWEAQPVFAEDPPEVHAAMRAEQQRNDPRALAAVLRGIGTGAMPPLWDRLAGLAVPVTILVGERDTKFHAPGRRMVELLPDAELLIVPGGHRLPLENPSAVADAIAREPAG
jgi:2-succinyl-6-hydroxy-2,4-cyclohexadiene-1-carboxylate synthase